MSFLPGEITKIEPYELAVTALIDKVTTMKDGGFRITLDISEIDLSVAQELMRLKSANKLIAIAFQEIKPEGTEHEPLP